jgi:hypothetical protein
MKDFIEDLDEIRKKLLHKNTSFDHGTCNCFWVINVLIDNYIEHYNNLDEI